MANFTGTGANDSIVGTNSADNIDGAAGADGMAGLGGDDVYTVDNVGDIVKELSGGGNDTVLASVSYEINYNPSKGFNYVENLTLTGGAAINGTGNFLANVMTGNTNNNTLDGAAGADTMIGGAGDDTYIVDNASDVTTELAAEGNDTVRASVNYTLAANVDNLTLTGTALSGTGNADVNILTGTTGANTLNGAAGADTMIGGTGNDLYLVDDAGDVVTENAAEGTDTISASLDYTLGADVENLTLTGAAIDGTGNAVVNVITGNSNNNTLDGAVGADTMIGGTGDDLYMVDDAGDVVTELTGAGNDTVSASFDYTLGAFVDNLILTGAAVSGTGNADVNIITGNGNANTLDGAAGADTLVGGLGDDVYLIDNASDVITEAGAEGNDTARASISYTLGANVENLVLLGTGNINGTGSADINIITGNTGNNTLDGAAGADTMIGGTGNDTYAVDDAGDTINENAAEGTDTVSSSLDYTLSANLENLTLTGAATDGTGNSDANIITGNALGNTLDGLAGADTMIGAAGDDLYTVDNTGDIVTEVAAEGNDTVTSSVSYTLGANVDNLTLSGTAVSGTGNADVNIITGLAGINNTLNGMAGADTMIGLSGDDTYIVDDVADVITEAGAAGTDTARTTVSYTLGANVDNLVLNGTASINGTGNGDTNIITGNSGNNSLDGLVGTDTMIGGAGNDSYAVDNAGDVVTELAAEGTDTVTASINYTLAANLENLTLSGAAAEGTGNGDANVLTGNAGVDTLTGLGGADTLDGAAGADTMVGGLGDDAYVVDDVADVITEAGGEGTDSVTSNITAYTIGANVENLTLGGTVAEGTGNGSANVMTGNASVNTLTGLGGADTIDGLAGADTMIGGLGDDIYAVDDAGDVVTEAGGEGADTVNSSVGYTLGANVDNLTLTGTASIGGTGNGDVNIITGNSGNNVLSGLVGADTMIGGLGDDSYVVDNAGDVVTEAASAGTDDVTSSVDYVLGTNVEHLTLAGAANDGTGNASVNIITGNGNANTLDGLAGADTMIGGAGDDLYTVDNGSDVVTELAAEGNDTVTSSVSYTLGSNVDNLTLTGTAIYATGNGDVNIITGNAENNTIDGLVGADTMIGGVGDDFYDVDNVADVITENGGEGTDQVRSNVTYTLGANVDNGSLTGSGAINLTGNGDVNQLGGNTGNNTLDGLVGADTMAGGAGDDTYFVDNAGDVVTEAAAAGTDTVSSSLDYVLGTGLENLILTGASTDGTGNASVNVLTGNVNANTLDGLVGADTMIGGAGDDLYTVDNAGDVVTELAAEGNDTVTSSLSYTLGSNVDNLTLSGTAVSGTGNGDVNIITGNASANTLSGLAGADTMIGLGGNDTYVVDDSADVVTEGASAGTDLVNASADFTLSVNLENLILTGSSSIDGTGNATANTITGNSGDNTLTGLGGVDIISAGAGADTIVSGAEGDLLTGGLGADTYIYTSLVDYTNIDKITDFSRAQGDALDISAILVGFDPITDAITDFVQITQTSNGRSIVSIDANGTVGGTSFVQLVTLDNTSGLTNEAALLADGTIIAV